MPLHDLWNYRDLLFLLVWRDIKVRYKQTTLGAAWAILQPVLLMAVFTLFFGKLAGVPSDGVPYPLFAYAGLLPWTFFAGAVTNSTNSIVGNASLITKVYFPRVFIPGAVVLGGLMDLFIAAVFLLFLMGFSGLRPTWRILALPALVVLTILVSLAVGLITSALNVKYRDVRYVVPFLVQFWMFVTPVIYPASLVPTRWRWALVLNPVAGLVGGYRSAFLGMTFDAVGLTAATLAAVVLFVVGSIFFRQMERNFADVI
jgi:lipopolysaccharide transport system permease protein